MKNNFECSFFMFPGVGLIMSRLGTRPSHADMLRNLGFCDADIKRIINNVPRGYYKDGRVAVYQEQEIHTPGYILGVKPENENLVRENLADLKRLLNLDDDTGVYFGLVVGKIGDVWELTRGHKLSDLI
ncbi:MAG: hypothetical protein LBR41_02660 [Rickettsiales bacterium]|jgi:hypothetical protein|nr:hypothetical protein [Rickettsiales bacterium]